VLSRARDTVDGVLAALLASPCIVCGRVVDQPTRGAACEACWSSIRFITPPYCASCGEPLPSVRTLSSATAQGSPSLNPQGTWCSHCVSQPPLVDVARALGPYEGTLRDLVHGLKYHGRRSIASRLAALLRERCAAVLAGADAVVPVPLHRAREWVRGFNQAEAIARGLGRPVWRPLRRTRRTVAQSTLPATQRWHNVRGAFALRRPPWNRWTASTLAGTCIVLVDDVSTTGATLDACAEVLKAARVTEVRALTVARAVLGHVAPTGRSARRW
jgi:ComF family protein